MSAIENVIAMVVLMGLFLAAFTIITGMNVTFFGEVVDQSVKEFNAEKYGNDLDAILNITEPVSKDSYANLLADAVYYRQSYFDYNAPQDLAINDDIAYYYNDELWPEEYTLQVNKLMQLTFNKLYGENNYYLEIAPLFVKLRLYFIIDGSSSLENEVEQLKEVIPSLIQDFNSEFDVVAKVFVLADGGLDQLDPCADIQKHADCKYLHKEEMYSNQVSNGWLRASKQITSSLENGLWNSPYYIRSEPSFDSKWILSNDEFLDETGVVQGATAYYCTWIEIEKDSLEDFKIELDFANNTDSAGVRMNTTWHNIQNGDQTSLFEDINAETKWQMLCIGYRPSEAESDISYKYLATPVDGVERTSYFSLDELFAFRLRPNEYEFSKEILNMNLDFMGGVFYEDWATASVYAAVVAEKENPSTLTVIIPISDELSLGSEAEGCEALIGFSKVFCERCNKASSDDITVLDCPIKRSSEDVNRAIKLIEPYGYSVFPILANSCDIINPYKDESNLVCSNYFTPYGVCGELEGYICGQCFGPDEMQCPGLTLENPGAGVYGGVGCDKKQCRPFINEQMQQFAAETGGKMIELTEIDMLHAQISNAVKDTIEKYKIRAGVKKEEEQRFVYRKLVPLSNRLFADLKFWNYKNQEET